MTLATKQMPAVVLAPAGRRTRSPWRWCLRALSLTATVLVAIAVTLTIVAAIAIQLSDQAQYTVFGHPVLTVLSGSMSPVIRTGDLIIDSPVTARQAWRLHAGQIISFRSAPGSMVIITHRIVGRTVIHGKVDYLTKGDANNSADTILRPAGDVIGVFRQAISRGGYILNALHRPIVPGMLLLSVLLWTIAGPLYRWAKALDNHRINQPGRHRRAAGTTRPRG
jgi:signal peptidase